MKKKAICILVLSLILNIFLSACNNEKKQDLSKDNQKKEQNTDKNGEIDKDKKTDEEKSKESVKIKNADKDMAKFSKTYLDIHNQDENAFIHLSFKDKDFIPKDLLEKTKMFTINGSGEEYNEEFFEGYKLIISCEDDILFRVSNHEHMKNEKHVLDSFYMSKGDFFLIELKSTQNSSVSVEAYKEPDWYSYANIYIHPDEEQLLLNEGEILQDSNLWEKEEKQSIFAKTLTDYLENNNIYEKAVTVDLDGDNKDERIYFWGETEHFIYDHEDLTNLKKTLFIDDMEISLDELSKENPIEGLEGFDSIEIIDINKEDKYKEIVLIKDDYQAYSSFGNVYHFKDGKMIYLGTIEWSGENAELLRGAYDNKLTVRSRAYTQFEYFFYNIYELKGEKIIETNNDTLKSMNNFHKRLSVYLNYDLNLYEKTDSKEPFEKLQKGDQLILLETDKKSQMKIKSINTGKVGYIKFLIDEENYNVHFQDQEELDNLEFIDIFYRLPYYP